MIVPVFLRSPPELMKLLRSVCLLFVFAWMSVAALAQEARTALIMGVWDNNPPCSEPAG
jgi:hypothetical protein